MMKNMASSGLTQGLVSALEQKKPWMLGSLAREFNVTERDVALALPEGMCALTSGENFVKVWEGLGAWEKAAFIVQHEGHVMEISCRIPAGSMGHGFYNLRSGEALGGHLRADAVSDIVFLSMPFMGLESHSVQFFHAGGSVAFAVYAGRENRRIIPSVKASFLNMRRALTGL
ncbi:heme utilization cystosolic carrier protein HutX [uncultured Mailhella sp.]|uniref:heme utilization cystosolic carrier protein HutX n=1 Tax=uncultured Mailhella sp. TaxID=1981031 RepID=UPI0025E12E9B|nr:heme utilization cystosolic carrier protein HutX [uncultured Mailhella sp.]